MRVGHAARAQSEPTGGDEPTRELLRAVNQQVRTFAADIGGAGEVDFVCECPNRDCYSVVRMKHEEFERIAAHDGQYIVCHAHVGSDRVVEEEHHFAVVERRG